MVHENIQLEFEAAKSFRSLPDAPNTYIHGTKICAWRKHGPISYALDPQKINGTIALVDLQITASEEDLDDIDLEEYCLEFISTDVLPKWQSVRRVGLHKSPVELQTDESSEPEL